MTTTKQRETIEAHEATLKSLLERVDALEKAMNTRTDALKKVKKQAAPVVSNEEVDNGESTEEK